MKEQNFLGEGCDLFCTDRVWCSSQVAGFFNQKYLQNVLMDGFHFYFQDTAKTTLFVECGQTWSVVLKCVFNLKYDPLVYQFGFPSQQPTFSN